MKTAYQEELNEGRKLFGEVATDAEITAADFSELIQNEGLILQRDQLKEVVEKIGLSQKGGEIAS